VGGVEQALVVDGDHAVPLLGVGTDDGAQEHQAGVVDQRVQPFEPLDGLVHGRVGLDAVGDVGFHDQRRPARVLDLGGEDSRRSRRRATNATEAPCTASSRAVAAPIPLLAPVIRATVPVRFEVMGWCSCSLAVGGD
jgi:hypothetical protein